MHKLDHCPKSCSGGHPQRQHALTPGQIERLSQRVRDYIGEVNEIAYRCGYCGCVYLRWPSPRVLGFLDNEIMGEGWHPLKSPQ